MRSTHSVLTLRSAGCCSRRFASSSGLTAVGRASPLALLLDPAAADAPPVLLPGSLPWTGGLLCRRATMLSGFPAARFRLFWVAASCSVELAAVWHQLPLRHVCDSLVAPAAIATTGQQSAENLIVTLRLTVVLDMAKKLEVQGRHVSRHEAVAYMSIPDLHGRRSPAMPHGSGRSLSMQGPNAASPWPTLLSC